ncbi:protein transport protein gos1 [Coemansia sp. RSA 2599]|nr:protein transport protein gos1 [Coemansia sp. RSA 2598]KAJ1816646.1 protein transport protein gos1 [Coemansia sp. RSA 2599]
MTADSVNIELPGAGVRPWEQLLRDVRELEMRFDTRIADYMKFVQPTSPRATISGQPLKTAVDRQSCMQVESEISTILGDLEAVISEMAETVQQQRGSSRVLERHQTMYADYQREFQRYRSNVQASMDRLELLEGRGAVGGADGDRSDRDRLVMERERIDQAHLDIDMVLDQAFSVRQELDDQWSVISGVTSKMVDLTERIPGINLLLGRIRSRKRKEKVVLAIVLAVCISILLFVWSD